MTRFSSYVDSDYLPGEIRRSTYETAATNPLAITKYETNKKWNFRPESSIDGTSFQNFLNWQKNPDVTLLSKVNLPSKFLTFMQMANGYN
jgi:hypothetical protein